MAGPHSSQYFSTSSVSFVSLSYDQHGIAQRAFRPLGLTETQAADDGAAIICHSRCLPAVMDNLGWFSRWSHRSLSFQQ